MEKWLALFRLRTSARWPFSPCVLRIATRGDVAGLASARLDRGLINMAGAGRNQHGSSSPPRYFTTWARCILPGNVVCSRLKVNIIDKLSGRHRKVALIKQHCRSWKTIGLGTCAGSPEAVDVGFLSNQYGMMGVVREGSGYMLLFCSEQDILHTGSRVDISRFLYKTIYCGRGDE